MNLLHGADTQVDIILVLSMVSMSKIMSSTFKDQFPKFDLFQIIAVPSSSALNLFVTLKVYIGP